MLRDIYQVVAGADGELKVDACTNLGNACCAWAEVMGPGPDSLARLQEAQQAYHQATGLDPDDAAVSLGLLSGRLLGRRRVVLVS